MQGKILFYNGLFITLDPQWPQVEAVYVENGKIAAVGNRDEMLLQFGREDVERVDLEGGFAIPGLVDNHLHLPAHGMKLSMLDFSQVTSKQEMLHLLRERVLKTPEGEWIQGLNWNENRFEDRAIPTLAELDEVAPNHPIFLTRTCYHTFLVNSRALKEAGVGENTPDPEQGAFGRDAGGHLNGLVYENASQIFREKQPQPSYDELKEYVRVGMADALKKGLTAVHTEDLRYIPRIDWLEQIYRELVEEGYQLRSHHLIYHPFLDELKERGMHTGYGDEWWRVGAVKIFSDGSIGGRTAYLSTPYHDQPETSGMPIHSQKEINEITMKARLMKMPIAVHAIGDRAAEMVITAMETHPVEKYVPSPYRDRLIHAQVMRPDLIQRLKRLRVAVDIQPRFVVSDFPWVRERLGEERLDHAYAWKTLIEAELKCGGGSDAPIEPIEPLWGIHAAVTRRLPGDQHEGYLAEQKLTMKQAVELFNLGSAYTAGEERCRGSLTPGKYADITVLDRNILDESLDPDELFETEVRMTITNGCIACRN